MLSFFKENHVSHETLKQSAELPAGMKMFGEPAVFAFVPQSYREIGVRLHLRMPLSALEQLKATEQELFIPVYVGMGARLERAVIDHSLRILGELGYQELLPAMVGQWKEEKMLSDQEDLLLGTVRRICESGFALKENAAFCGCSTFLVQTAYGSYPRHLISTLQLGKTENTSVLYLEKLLGPEGLALPCQLEEHSALVWLPSNGQYMPAAQTAGKPEEVVLGPDKCCVHSTWLAVDRVIASILENGQREDGTVRLPEVLTPYLYTDQLA